MAEQKITNVMQLLEKEGPVKTFEIARQVARDHVYKLRARGEISFSEPTEGEVPSIHVVRRTVPEAWETATMVLVGIGSQVHTGYDPTTEGADYKGDFVSFPSLEGTVMLHVHEPFGEPRFHKHFLGGWMGFGDYQAEIEGVRDHWVISPELVAQKLKDRKFDDIREDERWKYAYSQRIRGYPFIDIQGKPQTINQLNSVIEKLAREPLSKSGLVSTWDPRWDHNDGIMGGVWKSYDSPCLQNLWFRLVPQKDKRGYILNQNRLFRSHDHLKALPQNFYGLEEGMYEPTRLAIQEKLGVPVERGRLVNVSYSLHVYGHYLDPRMQGKDAEAFLQDIFRVAEGEPMEKRLVLPGTPMYDIMREEVDAEYKFSKANPDAKRAR